MALALAGKKFEDIRWAREDWPKYKADAPFGQAPYMEVNGKKYGQSVAMAAYLAREFGLYGKTNLDALRVDEVVQLYQDLLQAMMAIHREQDEAKKAELDKKLLEEDLPKFFGFFQKLLQENGTGVFIGNELTLADLYVYDVMYALGKVRNYDAGAKYRELQTLKDKVESNPALKQYLASRKDTQM
nr:hypothetical protein BaRGS_011450 [Batillaria attramentaria]